MKLKIAFSSKDAVARIKNVKQYKKVVRPIINKNLLQMRNYAVSGGTPVDTGELKNSVFTIMDSDLTGRIGYSKSYAPHVEYGHRLVRGGKTYGYVPGQYYFKANINRQKGTIKDDMEKMLKELNK